MQLHLFVLALILCFQAAASARPYLSVDEATPKRLKGAYVTTQRRRLEFDADGGNYVGVWLDGAPLAHSRKEESGAAEITIEGTTFKFSGNGTKLGVHQRKQLKDINGSDSVGYRKEWDRVMDEARDRGAYKLLEELSRALGRYGLRGHKNKPALSLFRLAQVITYAIDPVTETPPVQQRQKRWWSKPKCKKEHLGKSSACAGLCGRQCSCWIFVCGDCCFHQGCFQHDLCCARCGYNSWQCLNVWGTLSCNGGFRPFQRGECSRSC
eukprot:m.309023 g.309023  ORF g.309023 m.309023 type:complete len:267 (+) comp45299_c0_seq1:163-963(+)